MFKMLNRNEGVLSFITLLISLVLFFFAEEKGLAIIVILLIVLVISGVGYYRRKKPKNFNDAQKIAKILFIDDKECQIVKNLARNNFDVKKIDDVSFPATDTNVQWANLIFVDYKGVGKKLFGKKEGLGLIKELKRVYGNSKRYIIYSSAQDFEDLVGFPYIRKNASYDEFISLIAAEIAKL